MNNIDILEEKEKKAINNLNFIIVTDIYDNEVSIDKTKIINEYNESVGIVLNLVKTLIAENKELKEKNKNNSEWITNLSKENDKLHKLVTIHQEENKELKEKNKELEKKLDEISEIHFPIIY